MLIFIPHSPLDNLNLTPCSLFCTLVPLFPKDRVDLLFYQESLELQLIPWRLQSNLLSSLCPHWPSRQDPNPCQDIQVLQGTYTYLEISGTSETLEEEVQIDALIICPYLHLQPPKVYGWSQVHRTHQNGEPSFRNLLTSWKICPPGDEGSLTKANVHKAWKKRIPLPL